MGDPYMVNEQFFQQAVVLTAAFAQNGDIRIGGNTREDSTAMLMLSDLLVSAYHVVAQAHQEIEEDLAEKRFREQKP